MLRWENVISFYFISKANWKVMCRSRENFSFGGRTGSTLPLSAWLCKLGQPKGRLSASLVSFGKERKHPGLPNTVRMTRKSLRTHRAWHVTDA